MQRAYYVNASTRERTWVRPSTGASELDKSRLAASSSENWLQRTDATSGRTYYVNVSTRQTSWSLPEGGRVMSQHEVQQHESSSRQVVIANASAASQRVNPDPVLEEVEV